MRFNVLTVQLSMTEDPWVPDEGFTTKTPADRHVHYTAGTWWSTDDPEEADRLVLLLSTCRTRGKARKEGHKKFNDILRRSDPSSVWAHPVTDTPAHIVFLTYSYRPRLPVGYYVFARLRNRGGFARKDLYKISKPELAHGQFFSTVRLSRLG